MANRYWINGDGNWSDPTHWSDTSGGDIYTYGSEILTNGNFNGNANGWSLNSPGTGASYGSHNIVFANGSDLCLKQTGLTIVLNNYYKLEFDAVVTTGTISPRFIDAADGTYQFSGTDISTTGHYSFIEYFNSLIVDNPPISTLGFICFSNFSGSITNISLKIATPINLPIPTSSDNVFIDSNSGLSGGAITIDADNTYCNDFISNSGFNYTITESVAYAMNIYGSLTLESGLNLLLPNQGINFQSTNFGKTITISGANIEGNWSFVSIGGGWTLQDDLTITGEFYQENGTFNANDHNVTANDFYFYADTGYTPTVIMGNGTWEATGSGWTANDDNNSQSSVIIPETSTIKMTGEDYTFWGGGKTYNNLWMTGTIDGSIVNSNTFNDLKINAGLACYFHGLDTQTISSLTAIGTIGNLITLDSDNGTDQFTLSKSSGVVSCDYLDIKNSIATGGASWYAGSHSVDDGNNSGWIFTAPPPPNPPINRYFGKDY